MTVRVGRVDLAVIEEVEVVEEEEKRGLILDGEAVSGNSADGGSLVACDMSRDDDDGEEVKFFEREREDVEGDVSSELPLLLWSLPPSSSRVAIFSALYPVPIQSNCNVCTIGEGYLL